jgi:D-alanyl-D-alanine carboxypeptidase
MNARARDLGLARTFFDSPHGFESAELAYQRRTNTASCEDMCKLMECVMEDERLRRVAGTKSYSTVYFHRPTCMNSKLVRQKWENNSFLEGVEGWQAGKSGGAPSARYCMASFVTIDGLQLAGVVLGSMNKMQRLSDNQILWAHAAAIVRGTVKREEQSPLDGDAKWTQSEQL